LGKRKRKRGIRGPKGDTRNAKFDNRNSKGDLDYILRVNRRYKAVPFRRISTEPTARFDLGKQKCARLKAAATKIQR